MKKSIIILALLITATFVANAQETTSKHELRAGYSDASVLGLGNTLGGAVSNIFNTAVGAKIKEIKSSNLGMFEVGYRYKISDRVKIGADVSYFKMGRDYDLTIANQTSKHSESNNYVMVLPTAEVTYIKTGLINFYGTAAAGLITNLVKDAVDNKVQHATNAAFAFQVNPIGLRVGNKLGAFVEGGFGYKGFATAGLSYKF